MRKILLIFVILAIFVIGGCHKSSDLFLSFDKLDASTVSDEANHLTEHDFFSKDLVVTSEEADHGNADFVRSEAAMLFNITDQEVIYSKNIYKKLYPASLTKLATALVVLKHGDLTDSVTISYNASHIPEPGAKLCGFLEGDVISVETLLHSLLVHSGNDAGIAIAEHVGGTVEHFVSLMNMEAERVGAVHSNFVNPHGLHDNNHYSTAYDIYLIFNELLEYNTFRNIIGLSSYIAEYEDKEGNLKQVTYPSTNLFHSEAIDPGEDITVIGGKTGTTSKAGNCLVLLSEDTKGNFYISLILKASDQDVLYSEMVSLLTLIHSNE
ncbi:D-alanyl-D-alanine carboxypeptidase [Mobilitalea sibirica]|uniref:D-alanyl-D-alanine carboxypeptidase n=1 Tax=Mobilitalea sibirica TaxID=1462919 RepID=A0A8J7H2B8_9FIRM|nr:D-alanyl-D-alanine carboxypeptidase [Mobilitalea sibirica]MBH1940877.1 D-alanyl-D-alanine carboxypeptidase [Mobilitalea sibirica]